MRCYKIIVTCDVCGIFRKLEIISHIFKQNQLEACLRISEEGPSIQNLMKNIEDFLQVHTTTQKREKHQKSKAHLYEQ